MHTVIQSRMQTISMSAAADNFNEICKVKERLRAVLQITSAKQYAPIHFILVHLKLNRTGGSKHWWRKYKTTFNTKHKKRPTRYKDMMWPQQAIRSNTEHDYVLCTTMFIRRRILRVLPFVTRRWQPHTDCIPGCFIRPQTHIHTWKLEWSNYVNASAHSAAG